MFYGKYRAEVLDNNDPEQRGRLRLKCPKVMKSDLPLNWAESNLPPGLFDIPSRGAKVWVEFEEGNVDKPIWTGMIMTKSYAALFGTYDVDKKVFLTNKTIIVLDDKDNSYTLTTPTLKINGNTEVTGSINATGSITDTTGNTNHHSHPA